MEIPAAEAALKELQEIFPETEKSILFCFVQDVADRAASVESIVARVTNRILEQQQQQESHSDVATSAEEPMFLRAVVSSASRLARRLLSPSSSGSSSSASSSSSSSSRGGAIAVEEESAGADEEDVDSEADVDPAESEPSEALLELQEMFPDCDPRYIAKLLAEYADDEDDDEAVEFVAVRIMEAAPGYPRRRRSTEHPGRPRTYFDLEADAGAGSPAAPDLASDVAELLAVFPDCDPDYLYEQLDARRFDPRRVAHLSSEMLGKRGEKVYPKLKDKKRTAKDIELRPEQVDEQQLLTSRDFYDTAPAVSDLYKEYCLAMLCNTFGRVPKTFIRQVMTRFNSHFLPSLRAVEVVHGEVTRSKGKRPFALMRAPREPLPLPDEFHEDFALELYFSKVEARLKAEADERRRAKEQRLLEAQKSASLIECACCFGEFLLEDCAQCPDGHQFCLDCCRLGANEEIGKGRLVFRCMSSEGCKCEFSDGETRRFLPKTIYEKHQQRKQMEEIRQANIEGLSCCPFCPYSTVIENQDDKVFKCLNPECMKESCRLCNEENHVPLRCSEVEKKDEIAMRTYIEQQMTAALLRSCPKCQRKFYKTEGCNHMTCVCQTHMCYVCGKVLSGTAFGNHFGPGGCPQYSDSITLNEQNVRKGAQQALDNYLAEHPEAAAFEPKAPLKEIIASTRLKKPTGPPRKKRRV